MANRIQPEPPLTVAYAVLAPGQTDIAARSIKWSSNITFTQRACAVLAAKHVVLDIHMYARIQQGGQVIEYIDMGHQDKLPPHIKAEVEPEP